MLKQMVRKGYLSYISSLTLLVFVWLGWAWAIKLCLSLLVVTSIIGDIAKGLRDEED